MRLRFLLKLILLAMLSPITAAALAETLGDARVGFSAERVLVIDGQNYIGKMWHMPGEQRHEQALSALRPVFILRAGSAVADAILPQLLILALLPSPIDSPLAWVSGGTPNRERNGSQRRAELLSVLAQVRDAQRGGSPRYPPHSF